MSERNVATRMDADLLKKLKHLSVDPDTPSGDHSTKRLKPPKKAWEAKG
jgi:hypothetical protein